MAEWIFPISLAPSEQRWRQRPNAQIYPNPLTGRSRIVELPGAIWTAELNFQNLKGDRRRRISSFLARIRNPAVPFWLPDFSSLNGSGAIDTTSRVVNGYAEGVASWNSGSVTQLTDTGGFFRVLATSAGAANHWFDQQLQPTTAAGRYRLQFNYQPGSDADDDPATDCHIGTASGASDIANFVCETGRNSILFTAPGATVWIRFKGPGASRHFFYVGAIDVSPAVTYVVDNRARVAAFDNCQHAPTTNAVLQADDRIEIAGEFKQLTLAADSGQPTANKGFMFFEPAKHSRSLVNGQPIVLGRPCCRMVMTDSSGFDTGTELISSPSIQCQELIGLV